MTEKRHKDGWVEMTRERNGNRLFKNINNPNEIKVIPEPRQARGGGIPGYYMMLIIPGGHLPHTEINKWLPADDASWFLDYLFGLKKYDKPIKFKPRQRRGVSYPSPARGGAKIGAV